MSHTQTETVIISRKTFDAVVDLIDSECHMYTGELRDELFKALMVAEHKAMHPSVAATAPQVPANQCATCNGTGQECVGNSGQAWDGNAPVMELCGECGYAPPVPTTEPVMKSSKEFDYWLDEFCNTRDRMPNPSEVWKAALATVQVPAEADSKDAIFTRGFIAGFAASGEGWNGEILCYGNDEEMLKDEHFQEVIDQAVAALQKGQS